MTASLTGSYIRYLKQRKLFLTAKVDQFSIGDITKHIMQYNAEDKGIPVEQRQPILLYVASNGGDVDAGFELIDAILASVRKRSSGKSLKSDLSYAIRHFAFVMKDYSVHCQMHLQFIGRMVVLQD